MLQSDTKLLDTKFSVGTGAYSKNKSRSSNGEAKEEEEDDCLNEFPELEDEDLDDIQVDTSLLFYLRRILSAPIQQCREHPFFKL